ncbi:transcription initiation factor TFIID subunit 1 isoform X1 [Culex quinquefasciatus]|nr:transcription initiation factor TFIID subunit 1 isoform X1 [Culex quinquefasciatus]
MTDSENENDPDQDGDHEGGELNLAGFLFGNVDEHGRLENDFLDEEAKMHLSSLSRMGLSSFLADVLTDGTEKPQQQDSDSDDSSSSDDRRYDDPDEDNANYRVKAEDAVDYSDFNELAEELPDAPPEPASRDDEDYDDIEAAIPVSKVDAKAERSAKGEVDSDDEGSGVDDKQLMPPPSAPVSGAEEISSERPKVERKLDTPLAAMLPSKYVDVDVRELFPDFRPDKVLRFSRLFGPGKISSLPQIWRSVRRRRKKKLQKHKTKDGSDSTSDSDEPRRRQGYNLVYAPIPSRDHWASDDEDKLLSLSREEEKEEKQEVDTSGDSKPKVADWRFGPAQIWYDMLNVAETGEDFNYGFKQTDAQEEVTIKGEPIPDDAFLMVSQLHWEDDVVWDGNDIKHKVLQKLNSKINAAGWLPSSGSRTAGAFSQPGKSLPASPAVSGSKQGQGKMSKAQMIIAAAQNKQQQEESDDTWYSIFPVENEELVYSKWEDEVIWDAEAVGKIPKPKVLTLDPNDENIILGIPDDIDPSKIVRNTGPTPKVKIPHPHVKKSKILLGKAGVINVLAEDTPPPPPKSPDRDPFNISNDSYYMAKSSEATLKLKVGGGNLLQHSTPVVELRAPFVPTHMGPMKLRMFHRPPMKKYSHGALATINPQPVLPLLKHIKKKAKQRELERIASGGGDVFFMRAPEDLSGRDGECVLVEFCEEHPPLMNQVGMATKIKNYYKRKAAKDAGPVEFRYGETHYAHTSPFLGILHPGHCIQVVENNMYRAPIYPHNVNETDFLVIRTRNSYFIREIDALFTAGQECPLYEVPGPNSKRANNFVRDFLQVFIYRLFWKSRDNPRKIRMDDIKKAFPAHSESSIRKRLKQCADFKRTGMDSNFWVIKPEFRLPSEEEIRAMVSPEQCCAYFSMIAAEQRLKDAGYGEKFIFAQQEDDDEEMQLKMDDEVKVAPWNTTRAYIQAMRGKCILQLNGPADPTGCGEGFSYVRMPNKPTQQNKEEIESQPKRTVTGTDADLRRLSLNNAKALLRKFQVPEEEIKKLSRWEVIDVVRTLSTEKAKAGEEGMDKFSRGNRFSIAEHQERYKEECQRIFDLQNRVLASSEVLSTDEGESTASEESDLEELGKNLENMLANKKTSTQLSMEREEQERQELLRKIMEEQGSSKGGRGKKDDDLKDIPPPMTSKILKITRTFKNSEGREYTRVEIVRRSPVIDAYVKIRTTKDEGFIRQFATLDEAQKEEMKREKRRIQEQLRRIKRNQQKIGMMQQVNQQHSVGTPISLGDRETPSSKSSTSLSTPKESHSKEHSPSSRKKVKLKPDLKLKCGACGQVGHMRTNKACPLYTGTIPTPSLTVAMTEEQEEEIEKELNADDEDLVNVDGTKVKLSGKLLKRHEDVKRRTLLLKVPKDAVGKKRRRVGGDANCDYLKRHNKTANRRRTDPVVVLSSILEQILNEMRDMPDVAPFMFPVNAKQVADYHKIIQRPMDLQTIREYIRQKKYQTRDEFIADVNQIVENSSLYNGAKSSLTIAAQRMLQKCKDRMAEKEERLTRLEKSINPLLDDDDQVALSYMLGEYVNGPLKAMPESWPFLKPVNKRLVKDYYTIIRRPMDLEKVSKKVATHKYHSRVDFMLDMQLIADNCETYNGAEANFTKQARHMVEVVRQALDAMDNMGQLERNIALVQERARNEADIEWEDDERDSKGSRDTSPEFGEGDTSNLERPSSSLSMTSGRPGPSGLGKMSEKRSRGRPRKMQHEEEFPGSTMSHAMNMMLLKRSRGRPRKDGFDDHHHHHHSVGRVGSDGVGIPMSASTPSLASDPSASAFEMNWTSAYDGGNRLTDTNNPFDERYGHNSTVGGGFNLPGESGLFGRVKRGRGQYSTDDEEFEEVLDQSNAQSSSSMMLPPHEGEGDSQQAAEAMVQLSGTSQQQQYFTQTAEESMEIDPNYDPSDFLGMSNRQLDSVDGGGQMAVVDDSAQFQYQPQQDANFQQFGEPQQVVIGEQQQQPPQDQQQQSSSGLPPLQSLHKDLAISDSDDEQNNLQMDIFNNGNENENDDDGGDLWF